VSAFADLLEKAIAVADIACLRIMGQDAARISTIAKPLLPLAQDHGVAVLFDDADLALKLRADGVHLADPTLVTQARRTVGSDAIVGVACPLERHAAMEAGEAGADYVQFQPGIAPEDLELIAWWTEMMMVPSVVAGNFTPESARAFIEVGADFLAPDPDIWFRPDPVAAIAALLT
jgi:thiamine-phosphate pyrophosphorylase